MGLLPADEIGPIWYILDPNSVDPSRNATSGPEAGVKAKGIQRFVAIEDIIAVEGNRVPGFATSPKKFRQAFILLTSQGVDVTQAQLDKIERYRAQWESYFAEKTNLRGRVSARLDSVIYVDRANTGFEDGTLARPYNTIDEGLENSVPHGTLIITAGSYPEGGLTFTRFNVPLTVRASGGTVTIR